MNRSAQPFPSGSRRMWAKLGELTMSTDLLKAKIELLEGHRPSRLREGYDQKWVTA